MYLSAYIIKLNIIEFIVGFKQEKNINKIIQTFLAIDCLEIEQKLGNSNQNNSTLIEILRTCMLIEANNILPFLLFVLLPHVCRNTYIHKFWLKKQPSKWIYFIPYLYRADHCAKCKYCG